jgi:hypothetical protein
VRVDRDMPEAPASSGNHDSLRAGGRRDLPNDLAQFVVESTLGLHHGFWGLLANGATFESVRRRRTKPGQQVIRMHHEALTATERVVNAHVTAWRMGRDPDH